MRPLFSLLLLATLAFPQIEPRHYAGLRWRMIGPHRAGRTVGAAGIPDQPHVFYIGVNNGGVWKTTDAGRTWIPIFDDQPTGSIGVVGVAPSNPNIVYATSGEGLQRPDLSTGDGVYKSTDGGKTWTNTGIRDGQQISQIVIDPKNPDRVFVAVLGHPYGPNAERGIFRTTNGGRTWEKVLYKDEHTGGVDLAFDPRDANIVYAVLWQARQGPWENAAFQGPGSGLFKSTDGGNTWRALSRGLPTFADGLGRIGIATSLAQPDRLYALVDAPRLGGLYRSDDAGESWRRVNNEPRIWGRGSDFACVAVHPKNPDIVFIGNTASYKSMDGGATFAGFKGAPGGDDYHTIWINPLHPEIMLFATDQGATITLNGGETWSSWYNQPTAQFYHVITDNQFPYWVYGGQQESGSAGVASRGNDGQITFREWRPVGVEEYGYVAPDPRNPDIIYGGKASRYDRRTGEVQNITPEAVRSGKYRFLRTAPILFSPVDPRVLYLAGNVLFKTTTGGQSWDVISPDLSREKYDAPATVAPYEDPDKLRRRGVIYTLAPSYKDGNVLWAGTDDGLIHVTRDGGKTWTNVTPPDLTPWSKVSVMDASHFDVNTAYAAINRFRLDDLRPHIYRTRDGGKTWQRIVRGIPERDVINAVKEDHKRKGLLFAGSERAVYFSPDDGDNWYPLRQNMPATSIRDLVIKDDDVVVGTHGRSFWILDDISPLRDLAAARPQPVHLFPPQTAYRVRWNKNTDTPLPPEEPAGENPPDGAILYYWLESAAASVTLEILDGAGQVVRKYTSEDAPDLGDPRQFSYPTYWFRSHQPLEKRAGMHRFVWDVHHTTPPFGRREYPIAAIYRNTARSPKGPWAQPGAYTVRLTAGGQTVTRPLILKMDPRIQTPPTALARQFELSRNLARIVEQAAADLAALRAARAKLRGSQDARAQAFDKRAAALESGDPGLARVAGEATQVYNILQGADEPPTTQAVAAAAAVEKSFAALRRDWQALAKEIDAAGLR